MGDLDQPHSFTFIDDFGEAMVTLGQHEEALGQAWHVPNDTPGITQREFGEMIFDELGNDTRISSMGRMMMRIGGLFIPEARESVEMLYEFEKPFVVDSSKFEQSLDFQPTPIREGIHRTLEWYRSYLASN
jgi:nucleoside-diphosphate-sugar epimerase